MLRKACCLALLLLATSASADDTRDLLIAARAGDLAEVRRLIEAGVPVDASDDWGTTSLQLAVRQDDMAVVEYLLEKGASPDSQEGFFGSSVLGSALWAGDPEYRAAKLILAAGATNRVDAYYQAFDTKDIALARAALASGPVLESEGEYLRSQYPDLAGDLAEILAALETVADPPPPEYSADELAALAGEYQSGDYDGTVLIELADGGLILDMEETRSPLNAVGERRFLTEAGVFVRFFGRAGTVEGISVERDDAEPLRLGPGVGELVAYDASKYAVETIVEKTVNWPGFRGANRSGIGDGVDPPVEFDLDSGKGVAWRIDVPGLGNSSPIVWGDRVYVTTAVAEGGSVPLRTGLTGAGDEIEEAVEHRWLVLAYDKASGEKVWETEVGRGVPLTKRHFKATQANSTPETDGEHIAVVFPTAGLACLGMDGSIHWQHELGGLNAGGFNDPGLQWGFAASPIIHDGKVILQVDIHEGPYIAAWDLETGEELWRTERPDVNPSWATPAIWPTPDGEELVTNASIIRSYDPDSGEELWSLSPTSVQVVASPVVGETNVYVSSGYPPARPIYAVAPGIRGTHDASVDGGDAALAWQQERGGAYMPTPLLYRGLYYVVHHNGRLVAHDPATGGPVYRARFSKRGTCTNSPVAANGVIYQGTEEGTLFVFKAGPEYEELAVYEFGAPLMATPAISEGILLLRTPGELIALHKEE